MSLPTRDVDAPTPSPAGPRARYAAGIVAGLAGPRARYAAGIVAGLAGPRARYAAGTVAGLAGPRARYAAGSPGGDDRGRHLRSERGAHPARIGFRGRRRGSRRRAACRR